MRRWAGGIEAGLGLALMASCGSDAPQPASRERELPREWMTVTGNCGVSLSAAQVLATSESSESGCAAGFRTGVCAFNVTLGPDADPLSNGPGDIAGAYVSESTTIDGRPARLVRSIGPTAASSHFIGVHVSSVWEDAPAIGVTVTGACRAGVEDEARLVLSSLRLPEDAAAAAVPLEPTPDCSGPDERAIEGYKLDGSCPGPRTRVPGVCAVGAEISGSAWTGRMLCFVAGEELYYAFVQFGEDVIGTGARHGAAETFADELSSEEAAQCEALISELPPSDSVQPSFGGYVAPDCP